MPVHEIYSRHFTSFDERNCCVLCRTIKVHLRAKKIAFRKIEINYYLKVKTKLKSFNLVKFYRVMKFEKRGRLFATADDCFNEKESDTNGGVTLTKDHTVWASPFLHCNL